MDQNKDIHATKRGFFGASASPYRQGNKVLCEVMSASYMNTATVLTFFMVR